MSAAGRRRTIPIAYRHALNELIDVLLDAGKTAGGPPSTIVDATGAELRLIRPGAIAWDEVLACARVV